MNRRDQVLSFAQREFDAVLRTPSLAVVVGVYAVAVLAVPLLGGAGGHLPLVLNLLVPVEVLVPVLAFVVGYGAVGADASRGLFDVFRTYPVRSGTYVLGVFLGRVPALLAAVTVPLLVAWLFVPLGTQPAPSFLAQSGTVDDPAYVARFVVLANGYALVTLALGVAVASLARSRRQRLALIAVSVLLVVLGADLALLGGLATGVTGDGTSSLLLASSPASSFRGLVLALAATPVRGASVPAPAVLPAVVGLVGWLLGALWLARATVWRS